MVDDYWAPGQKMMGDIKFLDTLKVLHRSEKIVHLLLS